MAETVSHTPGPWKMGRGLDDDETRCFVTQAIHGQPEYVIAEIANGAPGDCLDTEVANALLIAAAPELLAALKAVEFKGGRERCPSCDGWNPKGMGSTPLFHAKNCELAAAIAKAEGMA